MSDPCVETCDMPTNTADNSNMTISPAVGGNTAAGPGSAAAVGAGMTYARALTDARTLIVQQSTRIKSDAQKLKSQQEEIAQLRAALEATADEVRRLRPLESQLAEARAGREHAEAIVGRQSVELESLETASRELQRMLGEQAARINEMTAEVRQLRSHLPTHEDAAALESMAALLSTARAGAKSRRGDGGSDRDAAGVPRPADAQPGEEDQLSGPGLARLHRERQHAAARERERREAILREMTIPADPTPFCEIAERRAA